MGGRSKCIPSHDCNVSVAKYVHLEKAEFRFLLAASGTCFISCFNKSCKQRVSTHRRRSEFESAGANWNVRGL